MFYTVTDSNTYLIDDGVNNEHVLTFNLLSVVDVKYLTFNWWEDSVTDDAWIYYSVDYSFDGVTWVTIFNSIANEAPFNRSHTELIDGVSSQYLYMRYKFHSTAYIGSATDLYNTNISVYDLVPESLDVLPEILTLDIGLTGYQGEVILDRIIMEWSFPHITTQVDGGGGGGGGVVDPTSTNIITGNVSKLGLPFKANVVAVSIGLDPTVVGETVSDEITGDYSIDIFPHIDEVLIYVAPDYGRVFSAGLLLTAGQIMHPTIPNKLVYVAQNNGTIGGSEPNWGTGEIVSNEVTFLPAPLHRPIMNGFVKPVITPI